MVVLRDEGEADLWGAILLFAWVAFVKNGMIECGARGSKVLSGLIALGF
jgi:hypothetical protein